ncbi:MAG: phosphatidate cytidylyltransferase, partial [Clostridia bacterium]
GFIGGIVAEIGDLVASRIKRELGIKDYGKIFPGHGGVMDRLDSIMSGVFVLFIAFTIIYQI